ncbi:hypothetical protein G5T42_02005 [Microbacterium sp. 4R-513]|uniref:hypothetical protein n=1 Tax=Microbacterium sp. 4R-513 TaxID=2567934 RepID=UPI0013E0F12C|nr:hypothetical protein [Microbacterium sp. 4R-513]QIG38401.1 hypothetical protein G5T42_02005 [Microbacterium sp. 4R-513]
MGLVRFSPPAGIDDVGGDAAFLDGWHDIVSALVAERTEVSGRGAYVNPALVEVVGGRPRAITWTGLSRPLLMEHRDDRRAAYIASEERSAQIEYLEWHVERKDGKVSAVTFTTETPEYWRLLASVNPDAVLDLYRRLVSPDVKREELFPDDAYDPLNRWNTTDGAVHYVMPINSMRDLLGVSQEVEPSHHADDGYDALPYSRATGADARINFDLWAISRQGHRIAAANPPGVYMIGWDDSGWTKPDGSLVGDYWTIVRGIPGAALRVEYRVPEHEGFLVGDIAIGGIPIEFGAQLAEHITMSAHVVAGGEA